MSNETIFADGFIFKRKENAPDFVVGSQSIKVEEAIAFLQANQKNGWVNLDIKQSKGGKYYCQLDTWQPKPKSEKKDVMEVINNSTEEMPF
jgi:hypothetical protein